jgi:hypothetical protein
MIIKITYETWVLPTTRQFADQLALILQEAGLIVDGQSFATVYLVGDAYPLEWGYNESQRELLWDLFAVLRQIIKPSKSHAQRKSLKTGHIRIHFAGATIFNEQGLVSVE